jgi:hypothetical protein
LGAIACSVGSGSIGLAVMPGAHDLPAFGRAWVSRHLIAAWLGDEHYWISHVLAARSVLASPTRESGRN